MQQHHYKLFICNADGDASNEIEYIEMLKKNKVDGIIGITYSDIDKYIKHWSQEEMAQKLNMSKNGYAKIKRGCSISWVVCCGWSACRAWAISSATTTGSRPISRG